MNQGVRVTSPSSKEYNCIAWAAGDEKRFWWPFGGYWPPVVPRETSLEVFVKLFNNLGYEKCDHGDLEPGYRKIAIYAKTDGIPTHAARQLDNGKWTSKLGKAEDVEHDGLMLPILSYGQPVLFLRRKKN
mgnify:CR=1 FL=1